jgi:hypothetical protein
VGSVPRAVEAGSRRIAVDEREREAPRIVAVVARRVPRTRPEKEGEAPRIAVVVARRVPRTRPEREGEAPRIVAVVARRVPRTRPEREGEALRKEVVGIVGLEVGRSLKAGILGKT